MKAMLLCAGEGTRLRPYTLEKPKPVIPFLGVPLLEYSLALLEDLEIQTLVANKHYLPDQIESYILNSRFPAGHLATSDEIQLLLGSGGGIRHAQELLKGDEFFAINGDEVILPHSPGLLSEMLKYHHWHKGLATLLVMKHPEVGTRFGGAWCDENNEVKLFSKTPPADSKLKGMHFLGVMLFRKDIFDFFIRSSGEENILYETLTQAISQGEKVFAHVCDCDWFETGNPKDFVVATEQLLAKLENKKDDSYCKNYLKQILMTQTKPEFLLEKENPELMQRIQKAYLDLGNFS